LPVDFVPLAALTDPALVAGTIALALGLREGPEPRPLDRLIAALGDRPRLLVLDNFERLLPAAPLVSGLLSACPDLSVLVTSRGRLHLSGERNLPVPPLPLPPVGASPAQVGASPAVRLFLDRARSGVQDFGVTAANAGAIAEICRRLDGLPLAIELAAARTRLLSPGALLARLADRLPLLGGGPRDAPPRLRSLRETIAWSHDLLGEEERILFRRLAVFADGFTLDAAEHVSRAVEGSSSRGEDADSSTPRPLDPSTPYLDHLGALVDAGLVRQRPSANDDIRFGMLETIREFAWQELLASGEAAAAQAAHAAYFLALAEAAAGPTRDPAARLGRIEPERGNLRAALAWAIDRGDPDTALRLAAALGPVWLGRGPYAEGRAWLEQALALAGGPAPARVAAQLILARLLVLQGEWDRAAALAEAVLALARASGDRAAAAEALFVLGSAVGRGGDPDRAMRCHEEALALYQALGDLRGAAETLGQLGVDAWQCGLVDRFAALAEEALPLWRAIGDPAGTIAALDALCLAARERGQPQRQAELAGEVMALSRAVGDPYAVASALWTAAAIAGERQEPALAARLYGAEEALRETIGSVLDPAFQAGYVRGVGDVRAALGDESFAAAWAAGRALTPDQAVAEALAAMERLSTAPSPPSPSRVATGERPDDSLLRCLTQRELEVLRLVAAGQSDKEIAATLGIARATASRHVATIRDKLGVASRAAAAAIAARGGLI